MKLLPLKNWKSSNNEKAVCLWKEERIFRDHGYETAMALKYVASKASSICFSEKYFRTL